jgi:hypothetical protein
MRSILGLLVLFLASVSQQTLAALLVIDYGSEWTKVSLMKPGMPFDVLLDRGEDCINSRKDDRNLTRILVVLCLRDCRLEAEDDERRRMETR